MCNIDSFKIDLKALPQGITEKEFKLTNEYFVVGPGFFLTHTTILFSESCYRYAQLLPIFCHRTSCDRESLLLQQFGKCIIADRLFLVFFLDDVVQGNLDSAG